MNNLKSGMQSLKQKAIGASFAACTVLTLTVPAFAADATDGAIDPAVFDGLTSGVSANVGAVLPKIIVVTGMLIGIGIVIGLVRKNMHN